MRPVAPHAEVGDCFNNDVYGDFTADELYISVWSGIAMRDIEVQS